MAILRTILHRLFFIVMLVIVYSTANAIDIVQGSRTDVTFNATPPTEYENGTTILGNDSIGISMLWSTTTGGPYIPVASNFVCNYVVTPANCSYVMDITSLTGTNYYVVRATSSLYSTTSADSNETEVAILVPLAPAAPVLSVQ
jgi:hypothetical protein